MAGATRGSSAAWASENGEPSDATWRPGFATSIQGRRPHRCQRCSAPAGTPGTATVAGPISYGICCPTYITSMAVPELARLPSRPGTVTKKSTHVTSPVAWSKQVAKPPPPSPVKMVSAAQLTSIMPTAASTALPPCFNSAAPASAVTRWPAATPARNLGRDRRLVTAIWWHQPDAGGRCCKLWRAISGPCRQVPVIGRHNNRCDLIWLVPSDRIVRLLRRGRRGVPCLQLESSSKAGRRTARLLSPGLLGRDTPPAPYDFRVVRARSRATRPTPWVGHTGVREKDDCGGTEDPHSAEGLRPRGDRLLGTQDR